MPTPRFGYQLPDGTRCPSVTTVLSSLGWSKAPLMHWAWKEGKEGRDYKQSRQKAADIGTIAHAMIESFARHEQFNPETYDSELIAQAEPAFAAFMDWWRDKDVHLFRTEVSIVCPQYRFGGTLDATGLVDNRFVLLDWKTSKAVYGEYVLQVAAYRHLWNVYRAANERLTVQDAVIVRVGKDGSFHAYELTSHDLDGAFSIFKALLRIHNARELIEAMVSESVPAMKGAAS